MKRTALLWILTFLSIPALCQDDTCRSGPYIGKTYEVRPGADYRAVLQALKPGEQLVLHEGVYEGPMIITVSGTRQRPIVIRGYGNGEARPEILFQRPPVTGFPDSNEAAVRVYGDYIVLDYLKIRSERSYGLRLGSPDFGCSHITVENCVFDQCGLGDLSANFVGVRYDDLSVVNNLFNGSRRTSVYIGNQEGKSPVTRFVFKGNIIDGSQNDGPKTTVGYGIELKLNVTRSVIEENFITGTKGPGIMVYGSRNTDKVNSNVVRNNIVINARKEAGIVVGGGPSVVQNNVVIQGKAGISIQNYGRRNLMDHVVVAGNTVVGNLDYGISFGGVADVVARDNTAMEKPGTAPFTAVAGAGLGNKSYPVSASVAALMDKVKNRVPERPCLQKLWRRVSSGPLTEQQLKKLMNLLAEDSRRTFVVH